MGPAAKYAAITFLAGVLLLFIWLYATTGNRRSLTILGKSLLLFVLPVLLLPFGMFDFPLGMLAVVAFEEALKAFAATREKNPANKFWLVSLFGIWELALDKPFWGLVTLDQQGGVWSGVETVGLAYASTLVVLMHTITAALYAFTFENRLLVAFATCCLVHICFNAAANYTFLSPIALAFETAVLAGIFLLLVRRHQLSNRGPTC